MKKSLIALFVAVASLSNVAHANESFGIMNDRLGSALQDNQNNNNAGTQARVNGAYNDAKQAIGGSMDTSKAPAVKSSSSAPTSGQLISGYMQNGVSTNQHPNMRDQYRVDAAPTAQYSESGTPVAYAGATIRSGYDVQGTPVAIVSQTPTTTQKTPSITGASYRAAVTALQSQAITSTPKQTKAPSVSPTQPMSTINVSITSLKPSTPVQATVNGVTSVTTAGELAKLDPSIQVAVPHVPAIIQHTGGNHAEKGSHSSMHGGSGAGGDNAHDHATGSHTGAGGGFHY